MARVEADFTGISSSFEPLSEGAYRFKLVEIVDQSKDDEWVSKNANTGKQPALVFQSEVQEGERQNSMYFDYIYTKTKEGKVNKVGLGKIKAYAEAIIGKEAANNPQGIDTDELLNGTFDGVIKSRKYKDRETNEEKTSTDMAKILPVE